MITHSTCEDAYKRCDRIEQIVLNASSVYTAATEPSPKPARSSKSKAGLFHLSELRAAKQRLLGSRVEDPIQLAVLVIEEAIEKYRSHLAGLDAGAMNSYKSDVRSRQKIQAALIEFSKMQFVREKDFFYDEIFVSPRLWTDQSQRSDLRMRYLVGELLDAVTVDLGHLQSNSPATFQTDPGRLSPWMEGEDHFAEVAANGHETTNDGELTKSSKKFAKQWFCSQLVGVWADLNDVSIADVTASSDLPTGGVHEFVRAILIECGENLDKTDPASFEKRYIRPAIKRARSLSAGHLENILD